MRRYDRNSILEEPPGSSVEQRDQSDPAEYSGRGSGCCGEAGGAVGSQRGPGTPSGVSASLRPASNLELPCSLAVPASVLPRPLGCLSLQGEARLVPQSPRQGWDGAGPTGGTCPSCLKRRNSGDIVWVLSWPLGHMFILQLMSLARGRPCADWLKAELTEQDTAAKGMRLET